MLFSEALVLFFVLGHDKGGLAFCPPWYGDFTWIYDLSYGSRPAFSWASLLLAAGLGWILLRYAEVLASFISLPLAFAGALICAKAGTLLTAYALSCIVEGVERLSELSICLVCLGSAALAFVSAAQLLVRTIGRLEMAPVHGLLRILGRRLLFLAPAWGTAFLIWWMVSLDILKSALNTLVPYTLLLLLTTLFSCSKGRTGVGSSPWMSKTVSCKAILLSVCGFLSLLAILMVKLPCIYPQRKVLVVSRANELGDYVAKVDFLVPVRKDGDTSLAPIGTTVLWKWQGNKGTAGVPFNVGKVEPLKDPFRLIGLSMGGVFVLEPQKRVTQWLIQKKSEVFFDLVLNRQGSNIIALSVSLRDLEKWQAYAMRVQKKVRVVRRVCLPKGRLWRFAFLNASKAVGYCGRSCFALRFEEDGGVSIEGETIPRNEGRFVGFVQGEPVFFKDLNTDCRGERSSQLFWGAKTVPISVRVWYGPFAGESYVFFGSRDGNVFKVDRNGKVTSLGRVSIRRIEAMGVSADRLWAAGDSSIVLFYNGRCRRVTLDI